MMDPHVEKLVELALNHPLGPQIGAAVAVEEAIKLGRAWGEEAKATEVFHELRKQASLRPTVAPGQTYVSEGCDPIAVFAWNLASQYRPPGFVDPPPDQAPPAGPAPTPEAA